MPTLIPSRACAICAAALAAAFAAGCGSAQTDSGARRPVTVTERDFKISVARTLAAGEVVLHDKNSGPDEHELIVARVSGSVLPLRSDGLTLNEEVLQRDEAGSLEPGAPGSERELTVPATGPVAGHQSAVQEKPTRRRQPALYAAAEEEDPPANGLR